MQGDEHGVSAKDLTGLIPSKHCRFYWGCDPIAYAQRAIAINEFAAPRWQNLKTPTGETVGNAVLDQRDIPHEQWWIWCASLQIPPCAIARATLL